MKFHKHFIIQWNSYFFQRLQYDDFYFFRLFVFAYIFVFVGNEFIAEQDADIALWDPISFFTFLEPYTWQKICHYSFYSLKVCALLSAFNFYYSLNSKICAISLLFNVGYFLNFGKVFHGYQLLCMTTLLLATIHCPKNPKNLWPLQLIKVYACSVYFVAAINKLSSSGLSWVFSDNLYMIIVNNPGKTWLGNVLLLSSPEISKALSFLVIFGFQLPAILAPFNKYFGIYILAAAIAFHIGVHLLLGGHTAFLSQCVCLLILLPINDMNIKALFQIKSQRPLNTIFYSNNHSSLNEKH